MQASLHKQGVLNLYDRVRIIGQGLAGSLLAIELQERGIPFIVQDADLPGCATSVAPGIVNPLAGRHFRPPEYVEDLMANLDGCMKLVEKHLGFSVWNPCPILRMFAEPVQQDRFHKSLAEAGGAAFVDEQFGENAFPYLNDLYGSFLTKRAGWANLPLLKQAARDWLTREGLLVDEEWIAPETAPVKPANGELVVFCEGWHVKNNPHWSFIPHNPAKGEMLMVRFDEPLPRDRIYNQSCWAQPIEDDLWRVGATYSWSDFDSNASLEGASKLQEDLHLLTPVHFHVEDQQAGVRPIVEDFKPVVGPHPEIKHWFILNAMGSKGVLQAPTAVRDLVEHLVEGSRIPHAWSVERFN
jgi:glycine/D-amino acid oxidase-like deaminating enzyme